MMVDDFDEAEEDFLRKRQILSPDDADFFFRV